MTRSRSRPLCGTSSVSLRDEHGTLVRNGTDDSLIDLIVSLREFQGDDTAAAELFADVREEEKAAKAAEEAARAQAVPGLVKPSDMNEEEL